MLNEINAEREQVDPGAVRLDEYVVERVSILFWLVRVYSGRDSESLR